MIRERHAQESAGADAESLALLKEMERSTPEALKQARAHARLDIRAKVFVQPGDMSRRRDMKLQGTLGNISQGGCQLLVPIPIHVGDIYFVSFDRAELDVPPAFARCMRCRVVREDAFEVGMAFFAPVELPRGMSDRATLLD
ncbi:MAG TPA: hypothetical protein DEB06_09560 [Phycisphaerales bacterium]|nr:hypothetical protein [Phycisphaerales bacterium]